MTSTQCFSCEVRERAVPKFFIQEQEHCNGQQIPDSKLSWFSARAGRSPAFAA